MKICYVPKRFEPAGKRMISLANDILEEYGAQGFILTVRQLYYQFVARDLFPDDRKWRWTGAKWVRDPSGTKNAEPNYQWLIKIAGDARLAGLTDWEYLEDRTRNLQTLTHFQGAADALKRLAGWYHIDMWEGQEYRPEVWIEKDALVGVIQGVCEENDVPYFSCRGYTSLSEMWRAARRMREWYDVEQMPYIIHFGDHDPSGVDMSRDIFDRINKTFMSEMEFKRVALTMDQIEEYQPPPNPAKVTDSRCAAYVEQYGDESWELDALEPKVFRALIEQSLNRLRDDDLWGQKAKEKKKVKDRLVKLAKEWKEGRQGREKK